MKEREQEKLFGLHVRQERDAEGGVCASPIVFLAVLERANETIEERFERCMILEQPFKIGSWRAVSGSDH